MPALIVRANQTAKSYVREVDSDTLQWVDSREAATVFGALTACALVDWLSPTLTGVYAETITEDEATRIETLQRGNQS